jgi:hypothetical protein
VEDFFVKRSLSKIGVTQSFESLNVFEVQAMVLIEQELMEIEAKNVKNRSTGRH